ncbi:hypothetical protein [Parafilimonas terrae]|jgi:hypothetical protein|uniref:Uncharacterized protein n=1 Tax=Parafilimonas terrae TaxID=1465490 RepID=A0A1I5YUF0_9BACT|nr:hypothetical protein [Parafilimonas terrae]SFQ47893.1 hypothetical protein SAMN05444277_11448 [Parafilimonas terrae]
MLLQLEETNYNDVNKLMEFARENNLKLSLVDEGEDHYILPGKPLTQQQITTLIESSRKSGVISMKNAHEMISNIYNAD